MRHWTLATLGCVSIGVLGACMGTASTGDDEDLQTTFGAQVAPSGLGLTVAGSSPDDGHGPENTLDGHLSTRWSSQGDGSFIAYALDDSHTVSRVDIAWHDGTKRKAKFDIVTSTDGVAFATAFQGTSTGKTKELEPYTFSPVAARFVRIVGHNNSKNDWNSITEVRVYGDSTDPQNVPPANPPGSGSPTPTSPPPRSPRSLSAPSDVLDLANWKLTLPVNTAHSGNPDEIKQPELDSFSVTPYFHLNDDQTGVVFQANAGGATTSNSGYPRSELREMANGGKSSASWSATSGTHTMFLRQAITHVPDKKPHVVAGQVHDASDDVILIRLEGTLLFVKSGDRAVGTLDANYKLGTVFTVKVVVEGGHIRVFYNDALKVDLQRTGSGFYFKAGCYTQTNTSKGDAASAYGEVVIYQVDVTHR